MTLCNDRFAYGTAPLRTGAALSLLRERVNPIDAAEAVPLRAASRRILATDVVADRSVPSFDNAAVDGYAFRHADLDPARPFTIVGRAAAGHPSESIVGPGDAVRIFTGAAMPAGSDTVAMQEHCPVSGPTVTIPPGLVRGANRRKAGEDVARGKTVLARGARLRPQDLGLAAAIGRSELSVFRRLRIALCSTGDEVRAPGSDLPPGKIYDANRYIVLALLDALDAEVSDLGILPDDEASLRNTLRTAASSHDAVISSGGVSGGDEDHVRAAVESLGSLYFWRLAIKPGRPLAIGQIGAVPFVGLPGNPVAAMVTFVRFVRPLLLLLAGATAVEPRLFPVKADFDYDKKGNRREWLRASLATGPDGDLWARKFEREGAAILTSLVEADGLVELPEETIRVRRGGAVTFLPFSEVLA
ncbi:MAG: molybdopterin molybdenumtransferase MoeA [Alphaproteobacteria bacterium]|nr:molybdopterin molybdenumtransferase MoeA [Alphaproteobacteria bacterium]